MDFLGLLRTNLKSRLDTDHMEGRDHDGFPLSFPVALGTLVGVASLSSVGHRLGSNSWIYRVRFIWKKHSNVSTK